MAEKLTDTNPTVKPTQLDHNAEVTAVSTVYNALKDLDPTVQERVIRYCTEMLGLSPSSISLGMHPKNEGQDLATGTPTSAANSSAAETASSEEFEGISAVAVRWIRRSGLNPKSLQGLFSLGVDEIDLVAKSVPGGSKRERMKSVLLLKGIAAYLGTGAPRVTYEQLKEACLHYNAYDVANFASYLKSFAAEVSGTKEAGFTLTARGLASGTELVKQILKLET